MIPSVSNVYFGIRTCNYYDTQVHGVQIQPGTGSSSVGFAPQTLGSRVHFHNHYFSCASHFNFYYMYYLCKLLTEPIFQRNKREQLQHNYEVLHTVNFPSSCKPLIPCLHGFPLAVANFHGTGGEISLGLLRKRTLL